VALRQKLHCEIHFCLPGCVQRGISRGKISGYLYFRPQKGLLILILSNQAAIALFAVEHERKMYFDCFANGIKLALMLFF